MSDGDWTRGSRGILDLGIVAAGVALVALGAFMALADYAQDVNSSRALDITGETNAFDPSYRLAFVPWLLGIVTFLTAAVLWRAIRLRQAPRLARHAKRPLALLFVGSGIADFAYYADTSFGLTAPNAVRAIGIDPLYALAGVFIAGAAWRLRSLIVPLKPGDPDLV